MDYDQLMDEATKAFISTTSSFYPEHRDELGIEAQRGCYNDLCQHFHPGRPTGITVTDRPINGVNTRHFSKTETPQAHILYIHGGGFVVGNLDTHDDVTAAIADRTGFDVTAVDYRLAPEHKAPAALDDCRTVLTHLLENTDMPVIVSGDSAGGYLSAMLALEFGQRLAGQMLLYPMLGGRMDQGSYLDHANAPMLNTDQVQYYWEIYFDQPVPRDVETLPMSAEDHSTLPPAVIIGAGCDPLLSDAQQYAQKLMDAGMPVTLHIEDGLPHGYMRARHSVPKAAASFDRIIEGFLALAQR